MKTSFRSFWLDALAFRGRLFSRSQVREVGTGTEACARRERRLLASLFSAGLARELVLLARPTPRIDGPLACWGPDKPTPDFDAIQYLAEKRQYAPVAATKVIVGTEKLSNILGASCGGKINHHAASHDLGVSNVYLFQVKTNRYPDLSWQGEDIVAPTRVGQKLPDALLYSAQGEPVLAVEYIGDYPATRIAAFHEDCAARRLPYEVY